MRAVLSLYLHNVLKYSEKTATVYFHIWAGLCYFFPLFGGIIADTFLGKFKTIVYLSLVYLKLPQRELTMIGLLLVALGTGGIKPCVSAFGGDQFILPEQAKQLGTFFSVFYFAINTGSLLSTFVTPIFRNDIKCFGQNACFPLAFGVPAMLMVVAVFVFMALFDQQGSRWTFQANRMSGLIYGDFSIHPDQIQLINPLLILIFIPLFQYGVYPIIEKCGVTTPLRKLFIGGQLAAVAFVISALVEFQIRSHCHPAGKQFSLRIYNSMDCDFTFYSPVNNKNEKMLKSFDMLALHNIPVNGTQHFATTFKPSGSCPYVLNKTFESSVFGAEGKVAEYSLFTDTKQEAHLRRLGEYNDLDANSSLKLQLLYGPDLQGKQITFQSRDGFHRTVKLPVDLFHTEYIENMPAGFYQVEWEKNVLGRNMDIKDEGIYALNLHGAAKYKTAKLLEDKCSEKIHMVWLVPQYVIITAGEVMFSIPGLEFAFTQAPLRMKSVISACWLLTTAFGNLIVAVVAGAKIFENQGYEFLLFAGLMVLDMFVFALLAYGYKYTVPDEDQDDDVDDDPATFPQRRSETNPGETPPPASPAEK
ncbi:hypothetical protein WDU94_007940 [Cyamophila willieti]